MDNKISLLSQEADKYKNSIPKSLYYKKLRELELALRAHYSNLDYDEADINQNITLDIPDEDYWQWAKDNYGEDMSEYKYKEYEAPSLDEFIQNPAKIASEIVKKANKIRPTHWSSRALRGLSGAWWGPLATMGMSGGLGALAGRYVAAPILSSIYLDKDNMSEEEYAARKKKLRRAATLLGILPGTLAGGLWGAEEVSNHGIKGLFNSAKAKGENLWTGEIKSGWQNPQFRDFNPIPISSTSEFVEEDPFLTQEAKNQFLGYLGDAAQGQKKGIINSQDLFRAGVGAGLGYTGASAAAKVVSSVFGLAPRTKSILRGMGALAGALYGSGVIRG
jgi:hypothetical protein